VAFTIERAEQLKEFWPTGQPLRVLAAQWGVTVGYVSSRAKMIGMPSRQTRSCHRRIRSLTAFAVRVESRRYFEKEADRRGLMPRELEAMLVQVISDDRLVQAVLDDEEQTKELEGSEHG